MRVHILVLNFNGRPLLAECLPSVVDAARASRHECHVAVIDNGSEDDSAAWLAAHFPGVEVISCENRGLCSFNEVAAGLDGPVAVLLNNDIRLAPGAIDPLVAPLAEPESTCFMTAPQCWRFDGRTYEGFQTAVRWRWGLVQATALFTGHEAVIHRPWLTASAGAALAVDRRKFVELGGFDPIFLPGRLEDLDFCFRGWMAGYHARYVPEAVAFHRGMASFGSAFGADGSHRLALRNTLLFQWKNLRHPAHHVRQWAGLAVRLLCEPVRAIGTERARRWEFARAFLEAVARWRLAGTKSFQPVRSRDREKEFFSQFHPRRMVPPNSAMLVGRPSIVPVRPRRQEACP